MYRIKNEHLETFTAIWHGQDLQACRQWTCLFEQSVDQLGCHPTLRVPCTWCKWHASHAQKDCCQSMTDWKLQILCFTTDIQKALVYATLFLLYHLFSLQAISNWHQPSPCCWKCHRKCYWPPYGQVWWILFCPHTMWHLQHSTPFASVTLRKLYSPTSLTTPSFCPDFSSAYSSACFSSHVTLTQITAGQSNWCSMVSTIHCWLLNLYFQAYKLDGTRMCLEYLQKEISLRKQDKQRINFHLQLFSKIIHYLAPETIFSPNEILDETLTYKTK